MKHVKPPNEKRTPKDPRLHLTQNAEREILDTALMTAQTSLGPQQVRTDSELWGHLVESAVGAQLATAAAVGLCELFYWRDRSKEVDFVVKAGRHLIAIEVKSSRHRTSTSGLPPFSQAFSPRRVLLVGGGGIPSMISSRILAFANAASFAAGA